MYNTTLFSPTAREPAGKDDADHKKIENLFSFDASIEQDFYEGDDILFADDSDSLLFTDAQGNSEYTYDADLLFFDDEESLAGLFSQEEHGGMDVLLSGLSSLNEVSTLLNYEGTDLSHTDIIMLGNNLEAAKSLQESLSSDKSSALASWHASGETTDIHGVQYEAYTKDDVDSMGTITILVQSGTGL